MIQQVRCIEPAFQCIIESLHRYNCNLQPRGFVCMVLISLDSFIDRCIFCNTQKFCSDMFLHDEEKKFMLLSDHHRLIVLLVLEKIVLQIPRANRSHSVDLELLIMIQCLLISVLELV